MSLWASVTCADDPPALREARLRYKEGIALYKRGKNEEAYTKFVQAYAVLKNQEILYNLAQTEYLTGHLLEANAHLRLFVKSDEDHTDSGRRLRAAADKELADLDTKLGHIYVDAPSGARLALDGRPLEETAPLATPIDVMPGPHSVEANVGEKRRSVTVTAVAGSPTQARLAFDDPTPAPLSPTTQAPTPQPPSTAPSATTTADAPPPSQAPSSNGTRTVVRWSLTGLAVVGLGVGLGFRADASSKSDSFNAFLASHPNGCANPSSDTCAQVHGLQDDRDRSATLSTAFFIAGGVLAAGAIASWLFWPDAKTSTTTTWIAPSVGVRGAGVSLGGHF